MSTSSESEVDSTAETVLTRNPEHQVLDKLESEMTLAPSKTFRVTLPEKLLTLADLNRLKGRHASFQVTFLYCLSLHLINGFVSPSERSKNLFTSSRMPAIQ